MTPGEVRFLSLLAVGLVLAGVWIWSELRNKRPTLRIATALAATIWIACDFIWLNDSVHRFHYQLCERQWAIEEFFRIQDLVRSYPASQNFLQDWIATYNEWKGVEDHKEKMSELEEGLKKVK